MSLTDLTASELLLAYEDGTATPTEAMGPLPSMGRPMPSTTRYVCPWRMPRSRQRPSPTSAGATAVHARSKACRTP